jgi:hypothetical protein
MPGWVATEFVEPALQEVKMLRGLPEIVLLAGSARFQQAFADAAYRLALDGCIVLGKHVFKPGESWPLGEREKAVIHAVQFRMCELASRVHVVNVDFYIGQDTYNLIKHAMKLELPITFQEQMVKFLGGQVVTAHHFLQATRRTVSFETAAL